MNATRLALAFRACLSIPAAWRPGVAAGALGVAMVAGSVARADQFVDQANAPFKQIQADKRSDEVLLPLLVKMEAPPIPLEDGVGAALIPATMSGFDKLAAWAQAEPQKALIEGVKKVTAEENWKRSWAFAQPYGAVDASPDMVMAGMYVELGDPPMLAAADIKWLPKMRSLFNLLQIEATRLASEGKVLDAEELMVRAVFLADQFVDRGLMAEQRLGYENMVLALMRMRDLAYQDARSGAPKLTPENCRDLIKRLKDNDGLIGIKRMELPQAERLAAKQLIATVMPGGVLDPAVFSGTLARITSKGQPMRLFSEQAKWEAIAKLHASGTESNAKIDAVFNDWGLRWKRDPWDALLKTPTEISKISRTRFAAIDVFVGDMGRLFTLRDELRVEVTGTRTALGLNGFWLQTRTFPADIAALRPAFLPARDNDPFDPSSSQWLTMVVPGRGTGGARGEGRHSMVVFPLLVGRTYPEFQVSVLDDSFVLYSFGPDAVRNGMRRATQLVNDREGDYLVWPPMLSLVRQNQMEKGRLK